MSKPRPTIHGGATGVLGADAVTVSDGATMTHVKASALHESKQPLSDGALQRGAAGGKFQPERDRQADSDELLARLSAVDWDSCRAGLDARGFARLSKLLNSDECRDLSGQFEDETRFRSRIVMARHGFGSGEYRYFAEPLPWVVAALRQHAYEPLVPVANAWAERLGHEVRFPATRAELAAMCRDAGQARPTPLLLRYGPEDYNCLHQDLYGRITFPIQIAIVLSQPHVEFDGGEFVLTEQRPRRQSRVEVVPLEQGDAVVFCVNERPVRGARGDYRVRMRHGVSRITRGERFTLGIIFHDAE